MGSSGSKSTRVQPEDSGALKRQEDRDKALQEVKALATQVEEMAAQAAAAEEMAQGSPKQKKKKKKKKGVESDDNQTPLLAAAEPPACEPKNGKKGKKGKKGKGAQEAAPAAAPIVDPAPSASTAADLAVEDLVEPVVPAAAKAAVPVATLMPASAPAATLTAASTAAPAGAAAAPLLTVAVDLAPAACDPTPETPETPESRSPSPKPILKQSSSISAGSSPGRLSLSRRVSFVDPLPEKMFQAISRADHQRLRGLLVDGLAVGANEQRECTRAERANATYERLCMAYYAASLGRDECLRVLIDAGADVHTSGEHTQKLHLTAVAAQNGHRGCLDLLLNVAIKGLPPRPAAQTLASSFKNLWRHGSVRSLPKADGADAQGGDAGEGAVRTLSEKEQRKAAKQAMREARRAMKRAEKEQRREQKALEEDGKEDEDEDEDAAKKKKKQKKDKKKKDKKKDKRRQGEDEQYIVRSFSFGDE